jgi:GntR family transcriptional regulator of arabinose operon
MEKKPLYEMIYQHYKEKIIAGLLAPGDPLPTEKIISKEFNVSRITVIRALRELELENFIYRMQGSGSYVTKNAWKAPNFRDISKKTPMIISLVLPVFDNVSLNILQGIEDVAKEKNYFVTYHRSSDNSKIEKEIINEITSSGSHGIILYPTEQFGNMDLYSNLIINKFPLVLIDRKIPGLDISLVSVDNEQAFYEITNHLIELGHKKIIFIGTDIFSISSEHDRYQGFCKAHIKNHLPLLNKHLFSNTDIETIPSDYKPKEVIYRRECHYLFDLLEKLEPGEKPTAIAAVNDYIAEFIISVALERGYSIPGKYSVTGFDNLSFTSHLPVPLTTIDPPSYEIGKMAAIELFKSIASPGRERIIRNLAGKLIIRKSTGNPR